MGQDHAYCHRALQNPPRYICLTRRIGVTGSNFIRSSFSCNGALWRLLKFPTQLPSRECFGGF